MHVQLLLLGLTTAAGTVPKRGLSGLEGCEDAKALGLQDSWHYNWGVWPTSYDEGGNRAPSGESICATPRAAEFVPMFWGCGKGGNATSALWETVREDWKRIGVRAVLGFNEPDNAGQSNLTPERAAECWSSVDELALSFDPPLTLVGPGMTHWDATGGSPWLDQFLGNISSEQASRIEFLAQHDYSGNAKGIVGKADAALKKYGRRIWLTEFSVGSGADRAVNDKFAKEALPLFDAADSIARYSWFSTRNKPAAWVNESNLLPLDNRPGWSKQSGEACAQMLWLSQHGTAKECQINTLENSGCAEPKVAVYQTGDVKNCYCSNTSTCEKKPSSWQDAYTFTGTPPPPWTKTSKTACAASEMLWIGQHGSLGICQAEAETNNACTSAPTKSVVFEGGPLHNCYCLNATSCTKTTSTWQDLYVQPKAPKIPTTPLTTTGEVYKV